MGSKFGWPRPFSRDFEDSKKKGPRDKNKSRSVRALDKFESFKSRLKGRGQPNLLTAREPCQEVKGGHQPVGQPPFPSQCEAASAIDRSSSERANCRQPELT